MLRLRRNLHSRFIKYRVPATKSTRQAAAGQRRPRVHPVLLQALCTAPATKSALQVHQALSLPRKLLVHDRQPRASGHENCTPSAVPPAKSALQVHEKLHDRQPRASGDHTYTQSSCRLCVLRLPRKLHSRFTKRCACSEICCACHEIYTAGGVR